MRGSMKTLQELRVQMNLSQAELAEQLEVSQPTVAEWELGTTRPRPERWKELAKALCVKLETIVELWT